MTVVWYLFGVAVAGALVLFVAPSRFLYTSVAKNAIRNAAERNGEEDAEIQQKQSKFAIFSGGVSKRVHFQATASKNSENAEKQPKIGENDEEQDYKEGEVDKQSEKRVRRWKTVKALLCETVFTRSIPAISALSSVSVFSWVSIPTLCSDAFSSVSASSNSTTSSSSFFSSGAIATNTTITTTILTSPARFSTFSLPTSPFSILTATTTTTMVGESKNSSIGTYVVPVLFAIYAFSNTGGAQISSRLMRRFSPQVVFSGVSLLLALPMMLYFIFAHESIAQDRAVYALSAASFVFGICVGTFNNCLYALFASSITLKTAEQTSLPRENQRNLPGEAFCALGLLYCIFYTLFSTLVAFIPMRAMAALVAVTTIAASISFLCLRVPHVARCDQT